VFVVLGIQQALRVNIIVTYGLSGSTMFFHIIKQKGTIFEKKL
jgi:hypothetical protein